MDLSYCDYDVIHEAKACIICCCTIIWQRIRFFENRQMRLVIITMLAAISSFVSSAQKSDIFIDLGLPLGQYIPGVSGTYDMKFGKHLGLGGGVQAYWVDKPSAAGKMQPELTTAVFADLRGFFPKKKHAMLAFVDAGWNMYERKGLAPGVTGPNGGIYNALGLGYFRPWKKNKNAGGYITLKFVTDSYTLTETTGGKEYKTFNLDGGVVLSVGVKFK